MRVRVIEEIEREKLNSKSYRVLVRVRVIEVKEREKFKFQSCRS